MDITKMTIEELKCLAYDLIAQSEQTQNNLRAVNQEIANRQAAPVKEVVKEEDKKKD